MPSNYPTSLDTFTNPSATNLLTSPSHAQQHADVNDAIEAIETKLAIGSPVIGSYLSYTPTFPAGLTLGNGTVASRYCRVNDLVHYYGRVTFGSTTSLSGANVQVTVPVNIESTFGGPIGSFNGQSGMADVSAVATFLGSVQPVSAVPTAIQVQALDSGVAYLRPAIITSTVPFTWATSDFLWWNCVYDAA